jgi:methylated-DNA-[protein]-cysteine S-methyltransferase
LDAYFSGKITALSTIKTALKGTEFQQRVWAALQEIPAGTTCSYATIATKLGAPKAVRAVGMANSLNPIAIIVPCHRVIAASGSLSGYAGGIERKRWLIAHEAAHSPSFE